MTQFKHFYFLSYLLFTCLFLPRLQAQILPSDSLTVQQQIDSLKQLTDSLSQALRQAKTAPKKVSPAEPSFKVRLVGRGLFTTGNINRTLLEANVSLAYAKVGSVLSLDMNPRYTYGQQAGVLAERDYGTDLNLGIFHEKPFYGIVFGFAEVSNLRQINLRGLFGAGLGWRILNTPALRFSISSAILYETTDFRSETRQDINVYRNSTRLKGEYKFFQNKLIIRHIVFFQPALRSDNLRWNGFLTIELPITTYFSINTRLDNSYESAVVEGRKNNDTRWTVGFSLANWGK